MLRLYLARHGQTDWNLSQRLQGSVDIPLNETGREQARQLARHLDGLAFDQLYCSALARSRQTAEALGDVAPLVAMESLNERRLGVFEGTHVDGRNADGVAEYRRRCVAPDDELDGGESLRQHYERVAGAVRDIRNAHPVGSVLVVGHGATNAQFARVMLGLSATESVQLRQDNADVWLFDIHESAQVAARMWVLNNAKVAPQLMGGSAAISP